MAEDAWWFVEKENRRFAVGVFIRFSCRSMDIERTAEYHTGRHYAIFAYGILALHCQLRQKCRNTHVCQPCWPEIYQWEGDPRISQGFGKALYKRRLFKSDFTTRPTVVISIMNALVSLDTLSTTLIGDFKPICSHRYLSALSVTVFTKYYSGHWMLFV